MFWSHVLITWLDDKYRLDLLCAVSWNSVWVYVIIYSWQCTISMCWGLRIGAFRGRMQPLPLAPLPLPLPSVHYLTFNPKSWFNWNFLNTCIIRSRSFAQHLLSNHDILFNTHILSIQHVSYGACCFVRNSWCQNMLFCLKHRLWEYVVLSETWTMKISRFIHNPCSENITFCLKHRLWKYHVLSIIHVPRIHRFV